MADSPQRKAKTPPASADAPETREPKDASFSLSRWQETPAAHGFEPHVLAGAAALAGWSPGTQLTKSDLKDGVTAFLRHKPTEE